jgi:tRNA (cytidine/uridine-2'-O-)-methyltransferase
MHVVLYQPEIPPNTGNIIRICANTGTSLHLIRPLGFDWEDKRMRRAGLDYHEFTRVILHDSIEACEQQLFRNRWFAMTTKGSRNFAEIAFEAEDVVLFGPETRGLPKEVLARWPQERKLRIPMKATSRSINLANAVAITLYEAWRQRGYDGIL